MIRGRRVPLMAALFLGAGIAGHEAGQGDEKGAVEATIRSHEQAVQEFDFTKANSLLAPDARWIEEDSAPGPADQWSEWWQKAKAARLVMTNRPHDFDIRVHGEVAWVTAFVDTTTHVDSDAARALTLHDHPNERTWVTHAVETEVLLKTEQGWRIVLGHTSLLPKQP
jgi:ketosteroid isomerase-like protein